MRFKHLISSVLLALPLSCSAPAEEGTAPEVEGKWSCFNGCYIVLQSGKYGLVNDAGEEILPSEYETIEFLDNDLALLTRDGEGSLCDRRGRMLLEDCPPDSLRLNFDTLAAGLREKDRRSWERVVDSYAALCKACKATRGQRITRTEFARLKALVQQVKDNLEAAGGMPTPSQKARLEALSDDYRRAFQ